MNVSGQQPPVEMSKLVALSAHLCPFCPSNAVSRYGSWSAIISLRARQHAVHVSFTHTATRVVVRVNNNARICKGSARPEREDRGSQL